MWVSILAGVAWILYRIINNTGWILDDEICHYVFSRSVWENSDQVFNHWTRPGRNLVHCLAAPFGFTFARVYTLALAMIAVWVTFKVGRILKVRMLWLVPMMLIFQSWFPELSYPVLTQTPFMLFWILGVWLGLKGRWHAAGFCFGYLSLIRHEGILLTAIWGMWVIFNDGGVGRRLIEYLKRKSDLKGLCSALGRDLLYGLSTISAIVLYNLAALIFHGSFPFAVYFESNPTDMYGSGTLFHYVPLLIGGVGIVSTLLSVVGVFSLRGRLTKWSLLLVTYPAYFLLHALIFWKGAFASGGYYHFLMPMAPFFALLSAEGVAWIVGKGDVKWRRVAAGSAIILVVIQGVSMVHHQVFYQNWAAIKAGDSEVRYDVLADPMEIGELSTNLVEASHWAEQQYPDAPIILAKHIAHNFTQGNISTRELLTCENQPLHEMEVGTIYIWDHQYCEHENRIKYQSFVESRDWREVKRWDLEYPVEGSDRIQDCCSVIIFEKVSKLDEVDKEYEQLGEGDKVDQLYD